jgi:ABC-type dipeptide/oligopeptide/nickel transport system permease subunit
MGKDSKIMSNSDSLNIDIADVATHMSEFKRFRKVFLGRILVTIGIVFIILFFFTAIFAPLLAPYNPYDQNLDQVLLPSSVHHILGTDSLGRDTFSRLIYGSRNSLLVGIVAVGIAALSGIFIGLISGYFQGLGNSLIMRIVDALMCFPMILLALVIAALLGGGMKNVIIALGIALLPGYARLMCAQVLSVKQNDYVLAERAAGANNSRVMFSHILPNCFPPLIVLITMQMGGAILAEAGLSFLGIGIQPPASAWGTMVSDGRGFLLTNPVLSIAPGLAIMLVVFSFNMVGDGLRDALDPRLRGTI